MDISPVKLKQAIAHALARYHIIIFVVVVLGGLAVAVYLLNSTVDLSAQKGTYTPELSSSFDQKTIDRVEQLKTRNERVAPLDLSHGRTNPFVE